MSLPLVSIVIPVFNGANYLREAIDSALAQTYEHFEVIVVNDGSTDRETDAIALSYGEKIRYFKKENGGVSSALNYGYNVMRGDYFAWLSHDDVFLPDRLTVQVNTILRFSEPVILYGDYEIINQKSQTIGHRNIPNKVSSDILFGLLTRFPVNGCTTLIPKICLTQVGLFDEHLKTTQDYDMWMRLALSYDFVYIPSFLLKSRRHSEQGSHTIRGHKEAENELYIRIMQSLPREYLVKKVQTKGAAFWYEVSWCLRRREITLAADYAREQGETYCNETQSLMAIMFWRWLDVLVGWLLGIHQLLKVFYKCMMPIFCGSRCR